jgi:hypothetical protein
MPDHPRVGDFDADAGIFALRLAYNPRDPVALRHMR